jgi:ATP-dependent exoDNAse (exonuclease V) alpha subunit
VLREEARFGDADTVARLLIDENMQEAARGQVLWIDEVSLLSTRTMSQVFRLADRLDARIVLQGDIRQHSSVARGSPLRLLETEAGLVPAEIREIKRQDGEYRDAVRALSEGRIEDGFRKLDAMGWIREADDEHRYGMLATDYADAVAKGEKVLVIAPTHAEGRIVTKHIRDELRRHHRLGEDERTFKTLANAQLTEAQRSDAVCY